MLDAQNEIAEAEFEEAKSRHQFVEAVPTDPRFEILLFQKQNILKWQILLI